MGKKNTEKLGTDKILNLIIRNSIPAILANLVAALYNVVDRIYIGRLGTTELTGIGLVFPIMTIFFALEIIISVGSGILVSIKLGEKNKFYAQKILGNAVSFYCIISILLFIICFLFVDNLMYLCAASEATFPFAKQYFLLILPFLFFQFTSMGLNNIIRAESNVKTAMATILIATITNIILDPIFIFTFKMGVKGAAIATDLGMIFSSIFVFYHFRINKDRVLSLHFRDLKLDKNIIFDVFSKGFPQFFMQIVSSIIIIILNRTLKFYGGDIAIGAMVIINTVFSLVLFVIIGLSQGCQPVSGYNFGAKNYNRVIEVMKYSTLLSLFITIPSFILLEGFTKNIVAIFCKDTNSELFFLAVKGLRMLMAMVVLLGFNITFINFFMSIGKAKLSMMLNLTRQVFLFIPALIIFPKIWGLNGIWNIYLFVDIVIIIITASFFYKEYKNFKKLSLV